MSSRPIIIVDENDSVVAHKTYDTYLSTDIYRVTALWVTNSAGDILLAQRKWTEYNDPGKWAPAAAGTVEQGETYEINMYKEAEEEIGITGMKFKLGPKRFVDGTRNKFFVQWYTVTLDRPVGEFVIQENEVERLEWLSRAQLAAQLVRDPEKFVPDASVSWPALFDL
ncbi:MAG TPA: NUDIX domain-containing protein [Candidatus Saccharimonadia bacterium]|nr:NUDIX domain-containing protein [Candidatus Saccharimonadia bacterium]